MGGETVHEFCRRILESGSLEEKLAPPRGIGGVGEPSRLSDPGRPALFLDRPVRTGALKMQRAPERLPRLRELRAPESRAICLEKFANHELMAVELFAWALLAYPDAPAGLRNGLVQVLQEEQGHVRLYTDRLTEVGSGLGQSPLGDYFWQQIPGIEQSANGLLSFLCVMGLTLEQANLDFSLLYRDTFRLHGDEESAEILDQIHRDEIGHVRLASNWLRRLADPGQSDVDAYLAHIPFPLSAARAKGRQFHAFPRKEAGLSEELIEFVRDARPYVGRSRPLHDGAPVLDGVAEAHLDEERVLYGNIGAEEGKAPKRGRREISKMASLWGGLFEDDAEAYPELASSILVRVQSLRGLIPWWTNPGAEVRAAQLVLPPAGSDAKTTRKVHDKAFAHDVVARHAIDKISQWVEVFDADEVLEAGFVGRVESVVASWPESLQSHFVLKPRIGTTGRGWVRGVDGAMSSVGGIQRLAQRGGAILEPWLHRHEDYSVQLWIDESGAAEVVGLTRQILSPQGMYLGNDGIVQEGRFELDASRGGGETLSHRLCQSALVVGKAAAEAGFRGACGIDSFTYEGDEGVELRSVVELNARFTGGWVVLGWIERLLSSSGMSLPVEWRFRWRRTRSNKPVAGERAAIVQSAPFCVHVLSGSEMFEQAELLTKTESVKKAQRERMASEAWLRSFS